LPDRERIVADADYGDLVSEADHRYRITGAPGFVAMKLLSGASSGKTAIWDAGRVVPPGATVTVNLAGFTPKHAARVVIRTAPSQSGELAVESKTRSLRVPQTRRCVARGGLDLPESLVEEELGRDHRAAKRDGSTICGA
jgi:hypothetical protein